MRKKNATLMNNNVMQRNTMSVHHMPVVSNSSSSPSPSPQDIHYNNDDAQNNKLTSLQYQ